MFELDEIERSLNRLIALSVLSLRLDLAVTRPYSCTGADDDEPSCDRDIFVVDDDDDVDASCLA